MTPVHLDESTAAPMYADHCALAYDDLTVDDRSEVAEVIAQIAQAPDGVVIDAACGSGRITIPVAEQTGRYVIAIDNSETLIELLRERLGTAGLIDDVEIRVGSVLEPEHLPRDAAVYILGTTTLCLFDAQDQRALLELAAASLRVDGVLLLSVFQRAHNSSALRVTGHSGQQYLVVNQVLPDGDVESRIEFSMSPESGNSARVVCTSTLYSIDVAQVVKQLKTLGCEVDARIEISESAGHEIIVARKMRDPK